MFFARFSNFSTYFLHIFLRPIFHIFFILSNNKTMKKFIYFNFILILFSINFLFGIPKIAAVEENTIFFILQSSIAFNKFNVLQTLFL